MSYALAVNELEGVWRVYCCQCREDIGTMTSTVLQRALVFSAKKGGVLCPSCRAKCCRRCGLMPHYPLHHSGFCFFCREENEAGMVLHVDDFPSCLVNLNSRDEGE